MKKLLLILTALSLAFSTATFAKSKKADAAIGTGLGASIILSICGIGDVILGLFVLFTRPKA
ncbi:TPA: hypothetical protein ACPG2T_000769 [Haemophilus influenzae 10810]|uniref:hypothetical protein n=1 Tax=Haemophilus influenzae TaxID=727 RepID=UPI000E33134C|nr:hypothetical protein [Haemophilus influenzae]AXP41822.1 hypothetical protein CH611_06345 [Haemophilus influenzae]AXP58153.1 hypothetical protein CH556_06350 [Haemophilus influenzae]MCK9624164.1 hypothetical protein [Haemophilus influenzae]RFO83255.1 hypothetical protein CH557_05380 [Haemophilus influenzae]